MLNRHSLSNSAFHASDGRSSLHLPRVVGPALDLFRISLSLCAAMTLLFTPGSKLVPERMIGEVPNPAFEGTTKLSLFYLLSDYPEAARILGICFCMLAIWGIAGVVGIVGVTWIYFSLHNTGIVPDGGDQIGLNASLICTMLIVAKILQRSAGRRFSVGHYMAYYSFLLLKIQVSFLYINASVAKIRVDNWMNGTEVFYDLVSPFFGLTGLRESVISPLLELPFLVFMVTWGTIAFELFIGISVFASSKWKAVAIVMVLILHGGIAILMGITSFSLVITTVALYALLPFREVGKDISDVYTWFALSFKSVRL